MISSASSCFLTEILPDGCLPIYDAYFPMLPVVAINGKAQHYWSKDNRRVLTPMEIQSNLETTARSVLSFASKMNPICDLHEIDEYFDKCDLNIAGFIFVDDQILAVTNNDLLGRHPVLQNVGGLLVYNTAGVIRVNAIREEIDMYSIIST